MSTIVASNFIKCEFCRGKCCTYQELTSHLKEKHHIDLNSEDAHAGWGGNFLIVSDLVVPKALLEPTVVKKREPRKREPQICTLPPQEGCYWRGIDKKCLISSEHSCPMQKQQPENYCSFGHTIPTGIEVCTDSTCRHFSSDAHGGCKNLIKPQA